MNRPSKTTINYLNRDDFLLFKERRRFESYKDKAHFYFDKLWQDAKLFTREEAYVWLAFQLNVNEPQAHFTNMSEINCVNSIYLCQQLLNDIRRLDLDFGAKPITPFYILDY